ncbi:MAG: hypothetical protein IPH84_19130 [Bacteroidales bacterium]|nr:hypothetical protein [Bacteroidales bacterium]
MRTRIYSLLTFLILGITGFAQVGINTDGSLPHNSAMLDVKSTGKGVLLPRMTYNELVAISSPAEGLMAFCTDCGPSSTGTLVIYSSGIWNTLNVNCLTPIHPIAGLHGVTSYQVLWVWSTVPGATGYKWNTWNNYSNATDMGTTTMKMETGLACNTAYDRYVWAYNACGQSEPVILNQTTMVASSPVSAL